MKIRSLKTQGSQGFGVCLQGGGIIIASGAGQGLDRVMVKEAAAIVKSSPKVRLRSRALAERADGLWESLAMRASGRGYHSLLGQEGVRP